MQTRNRRAASALMLLAALFVHCAAFGSGASPGHPNVVIVLLDDLGYSDFGFLGSEISTPSIDRLAAEGVTVSNFYVHPRCSPTRAALLTGRDPHAVGMGFLTTPADVSPEPGPYQGFLAHDATTLAELLRRQGYRTYLSGKWHLGEAEEHWPRKHGFDRYFGLISGASSYYELIEDQPMKRQMALDDDRWYPPQTGFYMTDAFTGKAVEFLDEHYDQTPAAPFFLYLAYTAPHWPLHAPRDAVEAYSGVYDDGPVDVRNKRLGGLRAAGLLSATPHQMTPAIPSHDHADVADLMAVYAAQVSLADAGIGRIASLLKQRGWLSNTLFLVMSDNGASAADVTQRNLHEAGRPVGERGSYLSYGEDWSTVSNTPFFQHKGSSYEGGVRAPLVLHWPAGLADPGRLDKRSVVSVADIYPTIATVAGAAAPDEVTGENFSTVFAGGTHRRSKPIFWEHLGWRAVRDGRWKAVFVPDEQRWKLFDLKSDPLESIDLAERRPRPLRRLISAWDQWSEDTGTAGFDTETFMRYYRPRPPRN